MATKKLRSMTFPGLTDNYTVPQKETDLEDFDTFTGSAIAIISNGNTHVLIPKDMFVYIHDHSTLSNGLYQNISGADIAANATLSSSNVELTSGGGLNQLKTSLLQPDGRITVPTGSTGVTKGLTGLTGNHVLVKWNFYTAVSGGSVIAENNPPQDMEWSTTTDSFTIKTGGSSSVYCQPVFALPTQRPAT